LIIPLSPQKGNQAFLCLVFLLESIEVYFKLETMKKPIDSEISESWFLCFEGKPEWDHEVIPLSAKENKKTSS